MINNRIHRRTLLLGLGSAAIGAACSTNGGSGLVIPSSSAPSITGVPSPAARSLSVITNAAAVGDRTLVVVELAGGNDSLSTFVPHGNGRYYDLRPTLAIENPLDLDGELGLHPELTELARMYSDGQMAIVEGIGTPGADLSHFSQMQRWWDGTDQTVQTGWLGRYLDGTVGYDEMLAGISIGPGPSNALAGEASFSISISDVEGVGGSLPWWIEDQNSFMDSWARLVPADTRPADMTMMERAIQSTVGSQEELGQRLATLAAEIGNGDHLEGDNESMTGQLRIAAHLIASGLSPKVIVVHGHTDFDTHENQQESHDQMMVDLNGGLVAFNEVLNVAGASDQAIVMTTSEFGRRVQDNNGGTDHGAGSTQIILGPAVSGGRYGEVQSLDNLDEDGNLDWSVDYRSMYATVLQNWLGVDPEPILHKNYETLPLLKT